MNNSKYYNPTQNNMKRTGNQSLKEETTNTNFIIKDGGMNSSNAASLKGKVSTLEEFASSLTSEVNYHRTDISSLKNEKDSAKELIDNKIKELKNTLFQEIDKMDEEITRHITSQKHEDTKLNSTIEMLKSEKSALAKELSNLQTRLKELEMQIGVDDNKEI